MGLAAGAIAIAAAGATEAAITGSANPADWAAQLVQQVQRCAPDLIHGLHGTGDCLSTFTPQHGKHASTDRPTSGTGSAAGDGKHAQGPPAGHPVGGPPNGHPDGGPPPMTHPGGGKSTSHPEPAAGGKSNGHGRGRRYGTPGPPATKRVK
jgi:hypothetical protein